MQKRKSSGFPLTKNEVFILVLLFGLSIFLMWKTFRVDPEGNMQISTKLWSDFAATIPLIRSFSLGANFPPQYPIFAGPPIRYHFLFFILVGFLEKIGIPIDWALNVPSAISFLLLLSLVYLLAKEVFKKKAVGLVSVLLFLFNGSFSFIEFFKQHPVSLQTPTEIFTNSAFPSFGPYDGKLISAFWNLNIFTNQRHLALGYAGFLFLLLFIYKANKNPKRLSLGRIITAGIAVGLFPFIHLPVFGMMGIALIAFFLIYPRLRLKIFCVGLIAVALAIPQLIFMGASQVKTPLLNPGYLAGIDSFLFFTKYWFFNLGLTLILAPIGFALAKKAQRKILMPFILLFFVGNTFQFSPEIAANHKFFNLFVIGVNMFTAYFLVHLWQRVHLGKIAVIVLTFFLTLSGIIDFFPTINGPMLKVADIPNEKTASFIAQKTPKNATFLNAFFLYDPASLAGRKIYLGWPYFAWSAGYDTLARKEKMQSFLDPTAGKNALCDSLKEEGIDFIELKNPTPLENTFINYSFFKDNFARIHFSRTENLSIYDVNQSCNPKPL